MNSLALFRFPLKEGHVPKRLVGVDVAIVGGSGIHVGPPGGISDPGLLGSVGSLRSSSGLSDLSGSSVSSNSSLNGSDLLCGSDGLGSDSFDFPCAIKDNPVKGLNTDSETWSLESSSC
jgi:hypothetical protein